MPGKNQYVNNHCFSITLVCGIVIIGYGLMFGYAPEYNRKKEFTTCITALDNKEHEGQNYTQPKCVSCADERYELASVRNAGEEKECGGHGTLGDMKVNDCCIKLIYEKGSTSFVVIFAAFLILFLFSFVVLSVFINKWMIEVQDISEASTEVSESSQPLMQPPVTVYGYPTAPTYMGGVPMYGPKP